jgi:hypothetical protein
MQAQLANDPDFQYLAVDRVKLLKEQTKEFDGKKMCWIPDLENTFKLSSNFITFILYPDF